MTRTPLLVVLMLSLGCVATDRSRVPEVRALMDKSAAQLAAGDGSASAAALREAAVLVPTHEYGVRMEIVERLMLEHDEFELAYRLMQQVIVDT